MGGMMLTLRGKLITYFVVCYLLDLREEERLEIISNRILSEESAA